MEENPVLLAERRLLNALWWNPNFYDDPLYDDSVWVHDSCRSMAKALDNLSKNPDVVLSKLAWYNESLKYSPEVSQDMTDFVINLAGEGETTSITDIVSYLKDYKKIQSASENLDNIKKIITNANILTDGAKEELRKEFDKAEDKLFSDENKTKQVLDLKEWGDVWEEEYNDRINGRKYFFNEPVLDELVKEGPMPGTGGLIVAASGMGKSAFCLKIVNSCINAEIPCMYFSLEMGAISTYDRLIASRLQIPFSEIINPSDEGSFYSIKEKVAEERKKLDENKYFRFCEEASLSLNDIEKQIKKFQEQIGKTHIIVCIDLLSMVSDFISIEKGVNFSFNAEAAINRLNASAKSLGFFYWGVIQLNNKSVESSTVTDYDDVLRFRPTTSHIRGSDSFLQRTRLCVSLFRKKFYLNKYFPDDVEYLESERDLVECRLLKANNNAIDKIGYELFEPDFFQLTPVLDSDGNLSNGTENNDDGYATTL